MVNKLSDVWVSRDYPVLAAAAARIDAGEGPAALAQLAADTGLSLDQVVLAIMALARNDYLSFAVKNSGPSRVDRITARAYVATGLHPDPADATAALVRALEQEADRSSDAGETSRLRAAAAAIGDVGGQVVGNVLGAVIARMVGA